MLTNISEIQRKVAILPHKYSWEVDERVPTKLVLTIGKHYNRWAMLAIFLLGFLAIWLEYKYNTHGIGYFLGSIIIAAGIFLGFRFNVSNLELNKETGFLVSSQESIFYALRTRVALKEIKNVEIYEYYDGDWKCCLLQLHLHSGEELPFEYYGRSDSNQFAGKLITEFLQIPSIQYR
ncbi:MAG: AtpZ/AtpI family protein [Microscillaceae bacterium]|nr:AtpZ/AtpI family protein [Microscillaceae bacterium]MDW8460922.1 hypothetical protein [Cytophagales bacterium]